MNRADFYAARRKFRAQKAAITFWHEPASGNDSDRWKFKNAESYHLLSMVFDSTPKEVRETTQTMHFKYCIMKAWFYGESDMVRFYLRHNSRGA